MSLSLCVTALMASVTVTVGYKIRRSDCFMAEARDGEESSEMHCTCGGIGDPYSIIMNKVSSGGRRGVITICCILWPNICLLRVQSQIWVFHGMGPGMVTILQSR